MSVGLQFLLMSLAAFRITRLLTTDDVLAQPRRWVVQKLEERRFEHLAELIVCSWCTGVYVSILIVAFVGRYASMPQPALQMIACAAVVGLLSGRMENAN